MITNMFMAILLNEHFCLSTSKLYCVVGNIIVTTDALNIEIKITIIRRSLKST